MRLRLRLPARREAPGRPGERPPAAARPRNAARSTSRACAARSTSSPCCRAERAWTKHTAAVSILFTALTAMMTGFVIGSAARFAVPGPDPMPFWLTVLIGLVGSAIGTAIGARCSAPTTPSTAPAARSSRSCSRSGSRRALVAAYRIFVQKRPLTGPDARRFPRSGFGIAKMRRAAPPARDRPGPDPHGRRGREAEAARELDARRRGRPAREAPRPPRPRDDHGRGVRAGPRAAAPVLGGERGG